MAKRRGPDERRIALLERVAQAAEKRAAAALKRADRERAARVKAEAAELPPDERKAKLEHEAELQRRRERERARKAAEREAERKGEPPPPRKWRKPPPPPIEDEDEDEDGGGSGDGDEDEDGGGSGDGDEDEGCRVHEPAGSPELEPWQRDAVERWMPQIGDPMFHETYTVAPESQATRFVALVVEIDPVTGDCTVLACVPLSRNRQEAVENAEDLITIADASVGRNRTPGAALCIVSIPLVRA